MPLLRGMAPYQQGGMMQPPRWGVARSSRCIRLSPPSTRLLDLGATLGAIEPGSEARFARHATPNKRDVIFDPALRRQTLYPAELRAH